jgi:hypothetical protein
MRVKYDQETKAKAIRLVREHAGDYPSEYAAITAVAKWLGMTPETLRKDVGTYIGKRLAQETGPWCTPMDAGARGCMTRTRARLGVRQGDGDPG